MSGLMLDAEPFLEFLGVQLDDDEAVAAATAVTQSMRIDPTWHVRDGGGYCTVLWSGGIHEVASRMADEAAAHIARHNPKRVLDEVTGIRKIIHKAVQYEQDGASPGGNVFGYHATGLFTALRHIAEARYADRPGYRDEWRP